MGAGMKETNLKMTSPVTVQFIALYSAAVSLALISGCATAHTNPNKDLRRPAATDAGSDDNVVSVSFGAPINRPFVSIKVCVPGTTNCTVVPNIMLDSGSDGLRILSSALPASLPPVESASGDRVAFSSVFGGTATAWGPYAYADVYLGNDLATNVPIQVLDSTFATPPAGSMNVITPSMSSTFGNGILGIGLGISSSIIPPGMGFYYCRGSTCSPCCYPQS
jgi:hypothetical protein